MAKKYKVTKEQIESAKKKLKEIQDKSSTIITDIIKDFDNKPELFFEELEFASKFYQYSMRNTALIKHQNPFSVYVQSFKAWKDCDTKVNKGTKGLKILVPKPVNGFLVNGNFKRITDATEEEKLKIRSGKIDIITKKYYGTGTVFDISQTDYPPEKYPEIFNVGYSSEQHKQLFDILCEYSKNNLNCPVFIKDVQSISLRGFFERLGNTITISDKLNDTEKLQTLSHELGHAVLHHANTIKKDDITYKKEVEADIFSILFTSYYGLEAVDGTKLHLKANFNGYRDYIKLNNPKFNDNDINKLIETSVNDVFEEYRIHIKEIDKLNYKEMNKGIELKEDAELEL